MAEDSNGNVRISLSVGVFPITTLVSADRLSKLIAIGFPLEPLTEDEMLDSLHNPNKVGVEYLTLSAAKALLVDLQESVDYLTEVTIDDHFRVSEARDRE